MGIAAAIYWTASDETQERHPHSLEREGCIAAATAERQGATDEG